MNRRWYGLLLLAMIGLGGVAGCRNCCQRGGFVASAPPPCCPPSSTTGFSPYHPLTPQRFDNLPGPMPTPRQDLLPNLPPAATTPPVAPPPDLRNYAPPSVPPTEPQWRPSPDSRQTPPPSYDPNPPPVRLNPPETAEPPKAPVKPDTEPERSPSPPLPVGIPQFQMVRNRLASGLKPSLEGGLDWLEKNGYRTIVHIRRPGEDDAADRRQVEKRGMKYVSIELSPQTLNREVVDQFNHVLADASSPPIFVYDHDGTLQGALWYLHFRIADLATDDEARVRAGRLGLRDNDNAEQRELWLAIQKFLSNAKP